MIPFQEALQSTSPITAAALAAIETPRPRTASFASHRNLTAVKLLRLLAANFPTIERILGADAFLDVAAQFVAQEAPTAPAATFYGDHFPAFLRRLGTNASADYIADIAAIDAACIAARSISDATAVPYARSKNACDDVSTRLVLHPSIILLQSKFPAVTGWRVNQPQGDRWVRRWGAEDALVACTRLEAEVWRLPDGGFAFLSALIAGASLADAAAAGSRASAEFDVAEMNAVLTASDIVVEVKAGKRLQHRRHFAGRLRPRSTQLQASVR